jgi:DNA-directed RNA polymerase subunit K
MKWPDDKFTRFEFARIIGARALQISFGAPVLVEGGDSLSAPEGAKLEFRNKIIPLTIKRKLPSGEEVIVNTKKATENWLSDYNDII